MIAGVVIAVVALGAGGWFLLFSGDKDGGNGKQTTQPGPGPSTAGSGTSGRDSGNVNVGTSTSGVRHPQYILTVGPDGNYPNLKSLLDDLKKSKGAYVSKARRQKINVTVISGDAPYGPVTITQDHPTGIYLKQDGVSRPKLTGAGTGPVVKIVDAEFFGLEGFDIDASGKDVAIEISGAVPRTVLTDLNVTGYRKTGILCRAASGDPGVNDVLKIEQVKLKPGEATSTGIRFQAEGDLSAARTTVRGCRILGPQEYGIVLDGGSSQVELRETIVDQAAIGVYFTGGSMSWRNLMVGNMTLHKYTQAGIAFSDMPSPGGGFAGTSMSFHRNLFAAGTGPELVVEKGFATEDDDKMFDSFLATTGKAIDQNWTDNQTPAVVSQGEYEIILRAPAEPTQQRVRSFNFISTDPGNHQDFLAIRKGSPYANIGGPRQETKPYIGAVAPRD